MKMGSLEFSVERFNYGYVLDQGTRKTMEDYIVI